MLQDSQPPDMAQKAEDAEEHKRVQAWMDKALARSPFVKFMIDNMHKRGCRVDEKDFFVVRHCDEKVGGGFDESASKHGGVVLCQNHIRDYNHTGAHGGMRARCCCGASTEGPRDCMHSVMTR